MRISQRGTRSITFLDNHLLGSTLFKRLVLGRISARRLVRSDIRTLRDEADRDCTPNHLHALAQWPAGESWLEAGELPTLGS